MSEKKRAMVEHMQALEALSPLGYTVGLHVRFASPLYYKSTYPAEWQDLYSRENYALRDPLVFWGISQTGITRWSRIALPDPFGVLQKAHAHGMRYGLLASCGKATSRSIVGVTRSDREFSDDEMAEVARRAVALHEVAEAPQPLDAKMIETLRLMGEGYAPDAVAAAQGMDGAALDACLVATKDRLGAETNEEALRMAREYRLI